MTMPELSRDAGNIGREYVHPLTGECWVSVTNITGKLDKSGALKGWVGKHAGLAAESLLAEFYALLTDPDVEDPASVILKRLRYKKDRVAMGKEIRYAYTRDTAPGTSFSPSDAGTLVHDYIEHYIVHGTPGFSRYSIDRIIGKVNETRDEPLSVEDVEAQIRPWFDNFLAFEKRFNPKFELVEATVVNRTVGYAGTMDLCLSIAGRRYLVDIKTGSGVYPEYSMQLEALDRGEFVLSAETGEETPFQRTDALAVLHLRPDAYAFQQVVRYEETWNAFLGLLAAKKWQDTTSKRVLGTVVRGSAHPNA